MDYRSSPSPYEYTGAWNFSVLILNTNMSTAPHLTAPVAPQGVPLLAQPPHQREAVVDPAQAGEGQQHVGDHLHLPRAGLPLPLRQRSLRQNPPLAAWKSND